VSSMHACARDHSKGGPHLERRTERMDRTKTSPRGTHDAETSSSKADGEMNMATSTVEHPRVVSLAERLAARRTLLSRRKGAYSRFRRNQQAAPGITVDEGGKRAVSYTHLDVYKRQVFAQCGENAGAACRVLLFVEVKGRSWDLGVESWAADLDCQVFSQTACASDRAPET